MAFGVWVDTHEVSRVARPRLYMARGLARVTNHTPTPNAAAKATSDKTSGNEVNIIGSKTIWFSDGFVLDWLKND